VRRISGPTSSGLHRVTWDLRWPGSRPVSLNGDGNGPLVVPGNYTVEVAQRVDGVTTQIHPPVPFQVEVLGTPSLPAADREALLAFQKQVGELQRVVQGVAEVVDNAQEQVRYIKRAIEITPHLDSGLYQEVRALELRLLDVNEALSGDPTMSDRNEPAMPGITSRIRSIVSGSYSSTSAPTATQREGYEIVAAEFEAIYDELSQIVERDLPAFQDRLEAAGVPWTPGRGMPRWERR
jgi:hypothetical protein